MVAVVHPVRVGARPRATTSRHFKLGIRTFSVVTKLTVGASSSGCNLIRSFPTSNIRLDLMISNPAMARNSVLFPDQSVGRLQANRFDPVRGVFLVNIFSPASVINCATELFTEGVIQLSFQGVCSITVGRFSSFAVNCFMLFTSRNVE